MALVRDWFQSATHPRAAEAEARGMDSGAGEQSTLAVIERKIVDLCREGGLPEPDVVLDNKNGEFTALWFESKVAVVIESDGGFDLDPELFADPAPAEPGDADLELELDAPEPPPEFFEALDHMAWLCEQGGFPKPDHAAFDESRAPDPVHLGPRPIRPDLADRRVHRVDACGPCATDALSPDAVVSSYPWLVQRLKSTKAWFAA